MGTNSIVYISLSVISLSFSILSFIYLYVRKQGAEKIVLKVIEVRERYYGRHRFMYPVCLVIENKEEREVEFRNVRMKKFGVNDKIGVEVYRVLKNDTFHYYSVLNYYNVAYVLLLIPIIVGVMIVINY